MRHLAAALAALTLALLVVPAAQAGAHKQKACGQMGTGILTVAKGRTRCSQARRILARAEHLPSGGPGASNKVGPWICGEATLTLKPYREGIVCTSGRSNELVLRWLTRAELQQKELRAECEKQVFPSLECEAAGFGKSEAERKRQEEAAWWAECEQRLRTTAEQEAREEPPPPIPNPAETKADCKAEHERDERENTL